MRQAGAGVFWDDEFAWEQLVPGPAPPRPRPVRRRRQTRTLAGDIARLRTAIARPEYGLRFAVVVLATAALATVVVMLLVVWSDRPEPRRPEKRAASADRSGSAALVSQREPIGIGDRGQAVRAIQEALAALGFDVGRPDGSFEQATRDAVVAFQQERGLASDGVVGAHTGAALEQAVAEAARGAGETARQGLAAAAAAGRLAGETAARYETILDDALTRVERMPLARGAVLTSVLRGVAGHSSVYDEPRALALFAMLEANGRYLAERGPPARVIDMTDEDGVVYRFVPASGFQFHPLANFAKLNAHASRRRSDAARRLAAALILRGVAAEDGLVWEYYFSSGGPTRWTSGFAQAVAADAFARAGALVDDSDFYETARLAFHAIPGGLATDVAGGAWMIEYSYSDMLILNAQLQSLLSLLRYAETTGDEKARAFAEKLETAARSLLPRFDTGCWSLYSLGGASASASYHAYHVALLKGLEAKTGEPPWGEVASRWERSLPEGSASDSTVAAPCTAP